LKGDILQNVNSTLFITLPARIRKHPEQALDMYAAFQEEMTHRVEVLNSRIEAGMKISDSEQQEMKAIPPYAQIQLLPQQSALTAATPAATASIPDQQPETLDYAEQEQNMRRLAQMTQTLKSLPKMRQRQLEATSPLAKMRTWVQSGEPALRQEALTWAYKRQDVEVVFDEEGTPCNLQAMEF